MSRLVVLAIAAVALASPAGAVPAASPPVGAIAFSDRAVDEWQIFVFDARDPNGHGLAWNLNCGDKIDPAWSRNGRMIAFSCSSRIYLMSRDGRSLHRLGGLSSRGSPAWSPDGSQIASVETGGWVSVTSIRSGRTRKITHGLGLSTDWSPRGGELVFDRSGPKRGIWVVGIDGSGLRRLTRNAALNPSWSPDGKKIAFNRDGAPGIYVISAAGGRARHIRGSVGYDPTWSPDSRWIASAVSSGIMRRSGISMIPVEGGHSRKLIWAGQPDGVSWGR